MNKLDTDYKNLLKDILENGVQKQTRNGEVLSIFGRQIRHKMSDGFPLLTGKKMFFKGIVTELLWFLRGDTNIKYLVDNGCNIWNGDCFANYINKTNEYKGDWPDTQEEFINKIKTDDEFSKKWGELGPIYGTQWRKWRNYNYIIEGGEIFNDLKKGFNTDKEDIERDILYEDQVTKLIHNLKNNPDDRGLIVSAWNVGDLDNMVLRPCHNFFQVYTRELTARERIALKSNGSTRLYDNIKEENYLTIDADDEIHKVCDKYNVPTRAISLMWNQRSVDTPLGLPFNITSYGLLLEIIAKIINMVPDELIGNLGDTHIYVNQIDGIREQLIREPYPLPTLRINTEFWPTQTHECGEGELTDNIDFLIKGMQPDDFQLENYQFHPKIYFPLSN
jgi:thymidylate synthase